MNNATKTLALVFAVAAGLASIEHGVLAALQGNADPGGLMIASAGPPCEADKVWNACEPAMTIIPNFFITGILAIVIGVLVVAWAVTSLERRHAGLVLIALSVLMLLFGGGIFPPLIGIIAGLVATRIHMPLMWWRTHFSASALNALAGLWPWSLIVFTLWLLGQWVVGYFFNDLLMEYGYVSLGLIVALMLLSPLSAIAHDSQEKPAVRQPRRAM